MKLTLRPMREADLPVASALYRESFRALLNVPDRALGDADYVGPRFRGSPETAFAAELDGQLVGTNFVANWGSVAVLGPVTVRTRGWTGGAGKALHEAALALSDRWNPTLQAGFTFAHSPTHVDFFVRTGMWPRLLTSVLQLPVRPAPMPWKDEWQRISALGEGGVQACRELSDSVYAGLDLSREIDAVARLGLGETVVVHEGSRPVGFAVCHLGAGTEAGSGACYVKFAAVRPEGGAEALGRVLDAVTALAVEKRATRVVTGVNTGRRGAYALLQARGFLPTFVGVAVHKRDEVGYSHERAYVLDDWR